MDRLELRQHEERLLNGLVEFYYSGGYKTDAYRDSETGGIYEHKLATKLGYELVDGRPPPEFVEAALILESQGFVRRLVRKPDFPVMGIWPTPNGLDRHEYLQRSFMGKPAHHISSNWQTMLVSFVTALVTMLLGALVKVYVGG